MNFIRIHTKNAKKRTKENKKIEIKIQPMLYCTYVLWQKSEKIVSWIIKRPMINSLIISILFKVNPKKGRELPI